MWSVASHPLGRRLREQGVFFDDFASPGRLHFLSHFHQDHMRGLRRGGIGRPIVLSSATARLAAEMLKVPHEHLLRVDPGRTLELSEPLPLAVRALEANHCPGAVMFLVECGGERLLYTGDFRLDDRMRAAIRELPPVDLLVVDNTYEDPDLRFPPQAEAIDQVVEIVRSHCRRREVAIATYSIGKTRILEALHQRLGLPTYVGPRTARAHRILGKGEIVTRDKSATPLRGYARGYFDCYFKWTREYRTGRMIAVIPTGWSLGVRRPEWNYHYVPYSEHCDPHEREEFIALVRPGCTEFLLDERPPDPR